MNPGSAKFGRQASVLTTKFNTTGEYPYSKTHTTLIDEMPRVIPSSTAFNTLNTNRNGLRHSSRGFSQIAAPLSVANRCIPSAYYDRDVGNYVATQHVPIRTAQRATHGMTRRYSSNVEYFTGTRIHPESFRHNDSRVVSHGPTPRLTVQVKETVDRGGHGPNYRHVHTYPSNGFVHTRSIETTTITGVKEDNCLHTPSIRQKTQGDDLEQRLSGLERELVSTKVALAHSETQRDHDIAKLTKKLSKK